ncbi:MAG: hypothetical protein KKA05_07410 [Alphaproteobacteria bacterium]|nr:hypothetical protein [Alphaproteobacteria bacterium]
MTASTATPTVPAAGPYYQLFRDINFGDPAHGYSPAVTAHALRNVWAENMRAASGKSFKQIETKLDAPRKALRTAGEAVAMIGTPFAMATEATAPLQYRIEDKIPTAGPAARVLLKGARYGLLGAAFTTGVVAAVPLLTGLWLSHKGGHNIKGGIRKIDDKAIFGYLLASQAHNNDAIAAAYIPSFARNEHVVNAVQDAGDFVFPGPLKAFALSALGYAIAHNAAPSLETIFRGTDTQLILNLTQGTLSDRLKQERFPAPAAP